jgi:hypothetical protein
VKARLIINVLLATGVFLITGLLFRDAGNPPEPPMVSLTDFNPEQILHIRIHRPGMDTILMTKTGTGWQIEAPAPAPANRFRVSSILGQLQARVIARFRPDESSLGIYGLDPSPVSLVLDDTMLTFGDVNPLDKGRYLLLNDTIYVVDDYLYPQLLQPVEFFINKRLLDFSGPPVRIQCGQTVWQKADGQWQSMDTNNEPGIKDMDAISLLWHGLETNSITPSTGAHSLGVVRLTSAESSTIQIRIKATVPDLVLSPEPYQFDYGFSPSTRESLGIPQTGC